MKEKAMSLSGNYFIRNMGQIDSDEIQFYSREGNIFFTRDGVLYRFSDMEPVDEDGSHPDPVNEQMKRSPTVYHEWGVVLEYSFIGSNNVIPDGRDRCTWNTNYFKGDDPAKWYTEVPNYKEIIYPELWDGIDLVYTLKDGSIKYDLIVHPGADPSDIHIRIDGANSLTINAQGDLVIGTEYWDILDSGLVSYYGDVSIERIPCRFELINDREYRIVLGAYDRSRNVVIDPLIDYSTLIGGSGIDHGMDIAVDRKGNAYVTGRTDENTTDFPTTPGAYNTIHNGGFDVFVTKLNPTGSSLVYSTFIGGSGIDYVFGIAIDTIGNAYITGYTDYLPNLPTLTFYPTTAGAYNTTHNGYRDVFVTKLNTTGSSLVYSTFIGGSGHDYGEDIAVDTEGNAYITGWTYYDHTDYPTTSGAYDTTYNGGPCDAFVTKLDPVGSSLVYSTFIGGGGWDRGHGIAVDTSGNAYITGEAGNVTVVFPTTSGAYDTTHNGAFDVFVSKLNPAGSSLIYSTFIGGLGHDQGWGIAIDVGGNAYVTGHTENATTLYPTSSEAYDTVHNGAYDVFMTKLDPAGSSLVYSTLIGGSGDDYGYDITIDTKGNAIATGWTASSTTIFPTTSRAYDRILSGMYDVFVTKLDPTGSSMVYSTFTGGTGDDRGFGIAIGSNGKAYVTGYTENAPTPYPTTSGAYDTTHNGGSDVFVTYLRVEDVSPPEFGSDYSTSPATTGDQFTFSIEVTDNVEVSSVFVEFWFGNGTRTNMSMLGGGPYEYHISIPMDSSEPLIYIFHANDTSNNWNQKNKRVVKVLDNDGPIFGTDSTPTTGSTGDKFTFSIRVTDNLGVSEVFVEYWFGYGSGTSTNQSMWGLGPYMYSYAFFIPADSTRPLNYIFHANDTANNWNHKNKRVVKVLDNDGPIFGTDSTPETGTTGDQFTFSIDVMDNT
ncbi:MAG: SBBP repeat-containing protein, partial [Thermoplasmatota archaeon]